MSLCFLYEIIILILTLKISLVNSKGTSVTISHLYTLFKYMKQACHHVGIAVTALKNVFRLISGFLLRPTLLLLAVGSLGRDIQTFNSRGKQINAATLLIISSVYNLQPTFPLNSCCCCCLTNASGLTVSVNLRRVYSSIKYIQTC